MYGFKEWLTIAVFGFSSCIFWPGWLGCAQVYAQEEIPHDQWTLMFVDNEAAGNGAATRAFDDKTRTAWRTQRSSPLPHEMQIDAGGVYDISGFRYLPRRAASGRVAQFQFFVSEDGVNWGDPVAAGEFANDATEKEVTFDAKRGRFVRFLAVSAVRGKTIAVAELEVLGTVPSPEPEPGTVIPRDGWTIHFVDSELDDAPATQAIDGDPATFWRTAGGVPLPHDLQINMGAVHNLSGFRYLPRQDSSNGRITQFEFYVSPDGVNWTPVATGTFTSDASQQEITFTATQGQYVRLLARTAQSGTTAAVAELNVLAGGS